MRSQITGAATSSDPPSRPQLLANSAAKEALWKSILHITAAPADWIPL